MKASTVFNDVIWFRTAFSAAQHEPTFMRREHARNPLTSVFRAPVTIHLSPAYEKGCFLYLEVPLSLSFEFFKINFFLTLAS